MDKHERQRLWVHLAVALGLAGFVAVLYYPLLFTNRVLATGDILLYFYPYRDFVASALREGRIPFWNPYLFAGAPLLANPQAAVLYPLHWPLSGCPSPSRSTGARPFTPGCSEWVATASCNAGAAVRGPAWLLAWY